MATINRYAIKNYKCKIFYQLCCTFSLFVYLFVYISLSNSLFFLPTLSFSLCSLILSPQHPNFTNSLSFFLSLMYLFHPLFSRFTEKGLMLWQYFCSYQLNTLTMDNLSRGRLSFVWASAKTGLAVHHIEKKHQILLFIEWSIL